jgi:hypothetical protein
MGHPPLKRRAANYAWICLKSPPVGVDYVADSRVCSTQGTRTQPFQPPPCGVRVTLVGRSPTLPPVSPPRGDFQVVRAWFAALGFSRGCPSALKHVGFLDSQSLRRTSQTFPWSPSTCDESIDVNVDVLVLVRVDGDERRPLRKDLAGLFPREQCLFQWEAPIAVRHSWSGFVVAKDREHEHEHVNVHDYDHDHDHVRKTSLQRSGLRAGVGTAVARSPP